MKAHQAKVPNLKKEIEGLERKFTELTQQENELEQKTNSLRRECEEKRSNASSHKSRGRVLDSIMEQKHSGRIQGVYGRLGDLGTINEVC